MKAVIQRVKNARVVVSGNQISEIGSGFLTLLGVMAGDTEEQLSRLMKKILELRVFEDSEGRMNRSLLDTRGEHLIVSQFTLGADLSQGKRPSFTLAEKPDRAKTLYEKAILLSKEAGVVTHGGVFGADMEVSLLNDGPATFILEI